jgi:ubiquinone/menaquinone biosynthesis C-methylase UbiE
MKSSVSEIVEYYDKFYESSDFSYYPENISSKFLRVLAERCKLKPGSKIIDVGCGTGFYVNLFTKLGFNASGIDISKTAIEKAKDKYPGSIFEVVDATKMPYKKNEFDMIFLYGCSLINRIKVEEINDYLDYLYDFLKEDGYLIYIGGSDLTDSYSKTSEWYNHKWSDLRKIKISKKTVLTGPYMTHIRLINMLGSAGYSKILNGILGVSFFNFKRMILIFIKKGYKI